MKVKPIIHNLLIASLVFNFLSCGQEIGNYMEYTGLAQGTSFSIKHDFKGDVAPLYKGIDSIFSAVDQSISTYLDNSVISSFNQSDSGVIIDEVFKSVFTLSEQIYRETEGDFDPSVAPLVWAYGFGPEKDTVLEDSVLDQITNLVGLNNFELQNDYLRKTYPNSKLDFNAIGQGLTVDLIANFLDQFHVMNYLVEIGGEVRVKGVNHNGIFWRVGIDRPIENLAERQVYSKISLENMSFATSGNYRKFYVKDGQKITHTIDPESGKTVSSNLLSATVIHESCASADAYATSLMVKGLSGAIQFSDSMNLNIYLIYSEGEELKEYISPSLQDKLGH